VVSPEIEDRDEVEVSATGRTTKRPSQKNSVCNLCVKYCFTRGITTIAALVRVNFPLVKKIMHPLHK
jgi:hypothetical protein